ncbi:MAG: dUTP diphosphatase [Bacteroidetes bacterium]|nr:dUTP diphosphatase [Bacteroidota bacterium]
MKVKVINHSGNPLPSYETTGSAGMDLRASLEKTIELQPLERHLIPTGIHIELPDGYEAQVRPRSGLAVKQGLSVLNSPGTIDSDYRGEIMVILINLSNEVQKVQNGDRIAQMVVAPFIQVELEEGLGLAQSERGTGGFGHTGTN